MFQGWILGAAVCGALSMACASGSTLSADAGSSGTSGSGSGGADGSTTGGTGGDVDISTEFFDCGSRSVTGAVEVSGIIGADTTWSGVVHVVGDVSVRNEAILTIEPGTKVIVGKGYEIDFGWEGSHPTLLAVGTPDAPILFCGEIDTPGYWDSLRFQDGVDPESVLRNVLIDEAGSTAAAALVLDAPVLIEGVQVVDSGGVGVSASAFGAESRVLWVRNSAGAAGEVTESGGLDWPDELYFGGNLLDHIELTSSTELTESGYFEAKGYGFTLGTESLELPNDGEGLTFRFGPGTTLDARISSDGFPFGDATLLVEGAPQWSTNFLGSVRVRRGTIRHAHFDYDLTIEGPMTLQDVKVGALALIKEARLLSDSYGIQGLELVSHLTITTPGCAALPTIPLDTRMSAYGLIILACDLDAEPVSLPNIGGEYALGDEYSSFDVDEGEHLTIEADVIVRYSSFTVASGGTLTVEEGAKLMGDSGMVIGGKLDIMGEPDAPVLLGPDVNEWLGLEVEAGADVVIDHAVIDRAGDGSPPEGNAALLLAEPIAITNSTISNSVSWGILHTEDDTTDYATRNTFIDNALGAIGEY